MSVDLIARGLAAKALAAAGSGGGGGSSYPEVATWAALPGATGSGDIYVVQTTTGIPLVNRKPAGLWRDSGAWDYLGNGISASDLINVPAGGLAATDVQSALNELDGDLGSHIGLGGAVHAVATGGAAGFMAAADKTKLDGVAAGATANDTDANLKARANHTGTQSIATILAAATARIFGRTTAGAGAGEELTAAQVRAMINVADGSTANSADATLLARANHTGTQAVTTLLASATARLFGRNSAGSGPGEELSPATVKAMLAIASTDISDWTEAVQDIVGPMVAAAGGTYDDAGNLITLPGGGVEYADFLLRPILAYQPEGATTTITAIGGAALTATGTATASAAIAATNTYTATRLLEYLVTVAATTAVAGWRYAVNKWFLSNNANRGGFKVVCRFSPATGVATATTRCFVGFSTATAAPTDVEPSTLLNMFGVAWDAADTNIQIMRNDGAGAATKIDLGANFPVPTADRTKVYELRLDAAPNSTTINYYFVDRDNPAQAVSGSFSTDIPAVNTMLSPRGWMSVGGTSSVIGIALAGLVVQG